MAVLSSPPGAKTPCFQDPDSENNGKSGKWPSVDDREEGGTEGTGERMLARGISIPLVKNPNKPEPEEVVHFPQKSSTVFLAKL